MDEAEQTKAEIYWYFTHLDELFQDDTAQFEENWRAIENADFSVDDLTDIIKGAGRFLVPDYRTKNVRGPKLDALKCVQENVSCWETPALAHLEDPNLRYSSYVLKEMGESLDRMLIGPFSQRFAKRWQELFFETLNDRNIDTRFIGGLKALAGIKSKDRRGADILTKNKARLMQLIESYADHLEGQHLSDLIYSLNKLNIVPNKDIQAKIMARAQSVLRSQIEAEQENSPIFKDQRMVGRHVSQFIFGTANMVMDWPDDLFDDFKILASKYINKPAEATRILHGLAMLYARTRDEKYKEFGTEIYREKLEGKNLSDSEKIQTFDACFVMDIPTEINRPAEKTIIGGEKRLAPYLNEIGIETSDKPLIIQGTGHHVDIHLLTEDSKRAVGIEFDGPSHFHIYFDHRNPDKTHRIYNGQTLMQMMIAEKGAPDAVIVRVPHSARLAKTEAETEFIRGIVEKACGDSKGRNKPAGVYLAYAIKDRGIILKPTKPKDGGPMRAYSELHF